MTAPTGPHSGDRPGPQLFPAAAAPTREEHPPLCPCLACTDALLAALARPLVPAGARTDKALEGRTSHPRRRAGEADARLAAADGAAVGEVPTGVVAAPVGAGDSFPATPGPISRRCTP